MPNTDKELEKFYSRPDPWGYFTHADDQSRKDVLTAELSRYDLGSTLDLGCGNGFITEAIPAPRIVGIDISAAAIRAAKERSHQSHINYLQGSLFELPQLGLGKFKTILITGVLYRHYIGNTLPLTYRIIDELLEPGGHLVSVHINEWYFARFSYPLVKQLRYQYRTFQHLLEIYIK